MTSALAHCRTPFAHDPGACDCRPSSISILLQNAEINEKAREEQRRADRWVIAGIGAACFFVSLIGFGAAAIVDQGTTNFKNWMVQNEPA